MSQHDMNIANSTGASVRADINSALEALVTLSSGATAPATTFAFQLWADTTSGLLKIRNSGNSAWIDIGTLASTGLGLLAQSGGTLTGNLTVDLATGESKVVTESGTIISKLRALDSASLGAVGTESNHAFSILTNNVERFRIGTSGELGIGGATYGTAGQILTSGGSGAPPTWANPAGVGFRNRIINGGMRIDQENNGSAITAFGYPVDQFFTTGSGGGAITAQRSTTAPSGFVNSVSLTVATADSSITSGDFYEIVQSIEGSSVSDFALGTASASTFTLSFWVRSSVAGTYCISFRNNASNRSYVAEYTINSANTFEYKTVTVSGDTSGTWDTGTNRGLTVAWNLGGGSSFNTTAGAWASGNFTKTTNQTAWISTLGATFFLTGVQVEVGSLATAFERRPDSVELFLCMKFYEKTSSCSLWGYPPHSSDTSRWGNVFFKVTKRATPTISGTVNGASLSGSPTFYPRDLHSFDWIQATSASGGYATLTAYTVNARF